MPDTTTRAQEIRAELGKLAPEPHGDAAGLARYLATEAQLIYTRLMAPGWEDELADTPVLGAYFAAAFGAARAVAALTEVAPPIADELAAVVVEGWKDGLSAGEWIAAYLGTDAERIAELAQELAEAGPVSVQPRRGQDGTETRSALDEIGEAAAVMRDVIDHAQVVIGLKDALARAATHLEIAGRDAVAAERERIAELADRMEAVCTGSDGTSCYFSALIHEDVR